MNIKNDEKLKQELIIFLMEKKYKDDTERCNENLIYLQSLDISDLDKMMGDYYLYEIKEKL